MRASVIIPLAHHDPYGPGQWKSQARCYPHQDLVKTLIQIAGQGDALLWWTEDEISWAMSFDKCNWAWVPCGTHDLLVDDHYSNKMTHMKIFFKDPNHAILFKLTWI